MPTTYQKPCDTHRQLSTRLLICIDKSQLNANHVHDRQYTCQALGWILTQYVDQVDFEQSREKPSGQLKCIASRADEKRQKTNAKLNVERTIRGGDIDHFIWVSLKRFWKRVFEIKWLRRQTLRAARSTQSQRRSWRRSSLARRLIGWLLNNLETD